ncbi:MAG: Rrf2 family transcriptional regulator [Candidatus Dadabacteria bacterium]|nr:Rrf2 family transcriptional regulator [Candidatus Dadabacteria bacterium]
MQVSRTLDYAVRSLTYMGRRPEDILNMKEIADNQHIPLNYLAKIMRRLVERDILRSMVGPEGGYVLRRQPSDITLKEIYEAIEGEFRIIDCMDKDKICIFYDQCGQLPVWDKIKISMLKILESTSLDDIIHSTKQ